MDGIVLRRHLLVCYHSSAAQPQGQIHQRGLAAAPGVLAFALCCPSEAIKLCQRGGSLSMSVHAIGTGITAEFIVCASPFWLHIQTPFIVARK